MCVCVCVYVCVCVGGGTFIVNSIMRRKERKGERME